MNASDYQKSKKEYSSIFPEVQKALSTGEMGGIPSLSSSTTATENLAGKGRKRKKANSALYKFFYDREISEVKKNLFASDKEYIVLRTDGTNWLVDRKVDGSYIDHDYHGHIIIIDPTTGNGIATYDGADLHSHLVVNFVVVFSGMDGHNHGLPLKLISNPMAVAMSVTDEDLESEDVKKATLTAAVRNSLPDSSFAYVKVQSDGTKIRKLPIHDKVHVKNALARFSQTQGIPSTEKSKVLAKIKKRAKALGVKVSDTQKSDSTQEIKKGTVVMHDFREKYDRESYLGVVVNIEKDFATIAAIQKDEKGYYYNGLVEKRLLSKFKKTYGMMKDYNLSIEE